MPPSTTVSGQWHYQTSPWRRRAMWFFLLPLLGLGGWMLFSSEAGDRSSGVIILPLVVPLLAGWQWLMTYTRLTLSADGVTLRLPGMALQAPWSAITRVDATRGKEGFVTSKPMHGRGARWLAALSGVDVHGSSPYDEDQQAKVEARRFIPIEAFAWNLRRGTLAADIARFAPKLKKDVAAFLPDGGDGSS